LKEDVKPLIPERKRIALDLQGVPQIDSAGRESESGCHDPSASGRKGSGPSVGMTALDDARMSSGPQWTRWFPDRKETQDPGTGESFQFSVVSY
jgi:hypothetical protein